MSKSKQTTATTPQPAPGHKETEATLVAGPDAREKSRDHQPSHKEISALAQKIYEEEGCPSGREEAHWLEAERRLSAQDI